MPNQLTKIRDATRCACKLQNVHACVRPVDDVNVASIVDLDVVRLDRDLTPLFGTRPDTTLIGFFCYRRDVVTNLSGLQRVAHVESANTRVEVGDKENPAVVDRREVLV